MVQGWFIVSGSGARVAESEKITINLGFVDLGRIDLLVDDRFYANRTDFIRTAIRNQLDKHEDAMRQSVSRRTLDMGVRLFTRAELENVARDWRDLADQGARPRDHRQRRDP